jgi:hypothetical protein
MRTLNPSWSFVEADLRTCEEICGQTLPPNQALMCRAHVSDWFRFNALARTGGVWMDMSCLCFCPLEAWVDMTSSSLQAFNIPKRKKRMLDNWALACPAGCPFMKAWAAEFNACAAQGMEDYRRRLPPYAFPGKGAVAWNGPYFVAHQIALKIMHEHPEFQVVVRSSLDGPLYYALKDLGHLYECVERLHQGLPLDNRHGIPFYKLSGRFRRRMDKHLLALETAKQVTPTGRSEEPASF